MDGRLANTIGWREVEAGDCLFGLFFFSSSSLLLVWVRWGGGLSDLLSVLLRLFIAEWQEYSTAQVFLRTVSTRCQSCVC